MEQVRFQDLHNMPYQPAWDYQTELHRALVEHKLKYRDQPQTDFSQEHHLLFVEHPPVYTLGKSGSPENLLLTEPELAERGIEYFPINRGGDITFHGPGQLVGYPILDLDRFYNDVHRYVRDLEEVMIRTIADYGLEGHRIPGYTGVWISSKVETEANSPSTLHRKVCAIGVHMSRWVTLHGWAFNVNTPLHYFDYIVPCGIAEPDKGVTSMQEALGRAMNFEEVKARVRHHFAAVFDCELVPTAAVSPL